MQMRAITKLLGEEMTAEVAFIGGLTQTVVMETMQNCLLYTLLHHLIQPIWQFSLYTQR